MEVYIRTYVSANKPHVIRTYTGRLQNIIEFITVFLVCSTNGSLVLVIVQWCALMCYNLLISAEKVRCFKVCSAVCNDKNVSDSFYV